MAPLSTNAILHFMHPAHKLNYLTTNTTYLCDGCQVPGTGSRFACTICSFDLHDYCAKCPTRLTSTPTHQHAISLVVHRPKPNITESCQLCRNCIKGLAYHCKDCNFWCHPLCISSDSAASQDGRVPPSGSAPAATAAAAAAVAAAAGAGGIGGMIGVGLATNWMYDQIKEDLPSVGSNASNSSQVPSGDSSTEVPNSTGADDTEDDEGFFRSIKNGFKSLFESVSGS